ncbi:1-phosphatidylinositol 4-kinase [Bertholletia excelsa]
MVRLLGLTRWDSEPREITRTNPTSESAGGDNGWLIRFFDSAFFCEWIAVSYLYKHEHSGVRDYLCNRMYTLPLSGIESYLFQICYMLVHKPSPSLDKFVIDMCSKSLQIALKVHWFLMAELEDSDDNEGISRIQEKCQIAATLMGEWPPLIRPLNEASSPMSKNQVLNKLLSSKRLLSLTSSPPNHRSVSFSPSSGNSLQDDGGKASPDENKILKKLIPGPKVRDALFFRKSVDKDDEESDKDGFFKRLLRDSRDDEGRKSMDKDEDDSERDGFFRRFMRDNRDEDEEVTSSSEGFFKRLFRDSKSDSEEKVISKLVEEDEKEGFFRKLFKEKSEEKKDSIEKIGNEEKVSKCVEDDEKEGFFRKLFKEKLEDRRDGLEKMDGEARGSRSLEEDEKEGFFRKFFKEKFEDKKDGLDRIDDADKGSKSAEDDEKEGFFRKLFKEKLEDKKDGNEKNDDEGKGHSNGEEEESSDFSFFRRLFRVHPEDVKTTSATENSNNSSFLESSPGTEKFFRKLFRDRDRTVEDSELFGLRKEKEKHPGSPKQQNEKSNVKPPLPNNVASQFRKGTYHESIDFVQSLCDTSYGLVDVFPIEDRQSALRESLAEINTHVSAAQDSGGVCFPMGKGMFRVVNIPEDEAVLLNSREKAPYLICVEVLKSEISSNPKDISNSQKLSKGGIPLANGDALLPRPPPWAYPLWNAQDMYHSGYDRMSRSTSQAIDQAMAQLGEPKVKFVHVNLSVETELPCRAKRMELSNSNCGIHCRGHQPGPLDVLPNCQCKGLCHMSNGECGSELEWVRVVLTADPGVSMDDIVDQEPPRRKEHRRVPSTVAIEEVKAATLKGEAPPGLPLKGAGQDSSDTQLKATHGGTPKPSDALSGELWEVKKERIRKASVHGKLTGWDLRSVSSSFMKSLLTFANLLMSYLFFLKELYHNSINVSCI